MAIKMGCEFANNKFIANFINYAKKKRPSIYTNSKFKGDIHKALEEGSIGKYFQNPTIG